MADTGTPRGMQPPDTKRVRITVPEGRKARYGDSFFPKVPFQSIFYISAIFIMLLVLAVKSPAPLQDPADPLNHAAIDPKPEWYFMFLFQLLKYFPGKFIVIGTVIIPTILVLLLIALPFYDRNWARNVAKRPIAVASMSGGMLIIIFLMWGGFGFPKPDFNTTSTVATPPSSSTPGAPTTSVSPAVAQIFTAHCAACHIQGQLGGLNLGKGYAGLLAGGNVLKGSVVIPGDHAKSYLWQVVQTKGPWPAGARMPLGGPYLSDADVSTIAAWIDSLKGGTAAGSSGGTTAQTVSFKKDVQPIFAASCSACHIASASGGLNLSYAGIMKGGSVVAGSAVKPGDHLHSVLWQIVASSTPPGGARMPLGGAPLSQAQINTIAAWIDQGAKNN